MTHSEMDELYELYLMGVLESDQAAEISDHLRRKCEHCAGRLQEASVVVAGMASLAEVAAPPPHLRERVLAIAAKRSPAKSSRWPLAFALASAAALAFLFWGLTERGTLGRVLDQMRLLTRQRNELRTALAILSESDTRTVQFGAAQTEPHGRVFVSQAGGVVFVGSRLPQLTTGKTFELWLVPAKGNPQAAGLFTTNSQGLAVNILARSINRAEFAAVAVSIEPDGGSPQPTSKPILVVPLA